MARIRRKELKTDEIAEAAFDVGHWIEANWRRLVKIAVPIVAAVLFVLGWIWNSRRIEAQGKELLARGMHLFQQVEARGFDDPDELSEAIDLFERAGERSGRSDAGRVARYFQGVVLYRLGRIDEAIGVLEEVDVGVDDAPTLGASKALLADLLVESGQTERAIEMLSGLADQRGSSYPPELALLQLGRIQQARGELEQARRHWTRLVEEYPQSPAAQEARQLLGS